MKYAATAPDAQFLYSPDKYVVYVTADDEEDTLEQMIKVKEFLPVQN